MDTKISNWAGNYTYGTANVHHPETTEQVQALVKRSSKIHVLGTRHSFNGIADFSENLIALDRHEPQMSINHAQARATIGAGVNYSLLCPALHHEGFALHNLASLPHISVAGACATGTHGSGVRNRNLAAAVSAVEIISAGGDLIELSREDDSDVFDGVVVGLGGLGVVIRLALDLLPTFEISQTVYEKLPLAQLEAHFDDIMSSAYSVSLFTDWQEPYINQVWLKRRVEKRNPASEDSGLLWSQVCAAEFCIPLVRLRRIKALNRAAFQVPGMSGCRTFALRRRRVLAMSCKPSISWRVTMQWPPCAQSAAWRKPSARASLFQKSAALPPIISE